METAHSPATFTLTEGEPGMWLATLEHAYNSRERSVIAFQIPRHNQTLSEVQAALLARAIQILQTQLDNLRRH